MKIRRPAPAHRRPRPHLFNHRSQPLSNRLRNVNRQEKSHAALAACKNLSITDPATLEEILASTAPLDRSFFAESAELVARQCLGLILIHGRTAGRIVETEAYLGLSDRAAHSFRGPTPRTRVLFGPPGHAYVYFIYGMYHCLNFVCEPELSPGCVLIRALEPLCGLNLMRRRRPSANRPELLANGPGKLTQALAIGPRLNGCDLIRGPLTLRRPLLAPPISVAVTGRIGIRHNAAWPLRFAVAGSPFLSRPAPSST